MVGKCIVRESLALALLQNHIVNSSFSQCNIETRPALNIHFSMFSQMFFRFGKCREIYPGVLLCSCALILYLYKEISHYTYVICVYVLVRLTAKLSSKISLKCNWLYIGFIKRKLL